MPAARISADAAAAPAAPTEATHARETPIKLRGIPRRSDGSSGSSDTAKATEVGPGVRPPGLTAWLGAANREPDDPVWPLSALQRRTLLMLQSAAGTRWQLQTQPLPAAGAGSHALNFVGERGLTATLRLELGGARWMEPDGRHWFVSLDAAALQTLSTTR